MDNRSISSLIAPPVSPMVIYEHRKSASVFDGIAKLRLMKMEQCVKSDSLSEVLDSILLRMSYFHNPELYVISQILHDDRPDLSEIVNEAMADNNYDEEYDIPNLELQRISKPELLVHIRELFVGFQTLRVQFARLSRIEEVKISLEKTFIVCYLLYCTAYCF